MPEESICLGPDQRGHILVARGDRIEFFGAWEGDAPPGDRRLECWDSVIEPGAVNAHTHIYSGLAPLGMPPPAVPPRDFAEILEKIWWRLDRALDAESLAAAARYYAAESLLAGTTTLIDHHESPGFISGSLDVLAEACEEIGIRAVLCYGATERNRGRAEAESGLDECRRFLNSNERPTIRGAVGLHASFTVSDPTVQEAGDVCREMAAVMHVHVAEDRCDLDDARRREWPGPLERLLDLEALPPGSILAHGVHLDADRVRRAEERQLWLVQNPRSNRGNGVGYPAALAHSRRVALGTDGYPSCLADEAQALYEEAAEHGDDPDAVEMRVRAGHVLAGERFGRSFAPLAEGAVADAVARLPARSGGRVRHALVAGRVVVEEGALSRADHPAIRRDAERHAARLWARMAALD
jgi:cytosine/adenosine deaminase-related metal-dependent hydrolase